MTAAPKRKRRWLRRLVIWSVAALLLLRVAIWIALPMVVESVLAGAGFSSRWERLDLSLLAGTVELSRLELAAKPAAGTPPPPADARLEYLAADLDVLALFSGTVRVRRVDIDGIALTLRRGTDGHVRLCGLDLSADGTAPPPPALPKSSPAPLDFTLPVQVMALRMQNTAIALRDDGAPQDGCHWHVALSASDVGVPDRQASLDLDVHGPGVLDALRVEVRGRASGPRAEVDLTAMARGLHPGRVATWLEPLGLRPMADHIDLDLRIHADAAPTDASGRVLAAQAQITGLSVRTDGSEAAAVDRAQVKIRQVQVADATDPLSLDAEVSGVRAVAERRDDGSLRLCGFDFLPGNTEATPPPPAAAPAPARGLALTANIRDVNLKVRRQALGPDAAPLELQLAQLTLQPVKAHEPQPFAIRLHAPGVVERIEIDGTLQPSGVERSATFRLDAEAITMARLQPLLRQAGLEAEIERASLRCSGSLAATTEPGGGMALRAQLADVVLRDRDDLLNWPGVEVEATTGRPGGPALDVSRIAIRGPELRARIDREGTMHFLGLRTVAAVPPTTETPPPLPQQDPGPPPLFRLRELEWTGLAVRLTDERHEPAAVLAAPLSLVVRDVGNTPGAAAGSFELRTSPEGVANELRIAGTLAPERTADTHSLRVQIAIEGATLMALRPWLQQAGIRSDLRDGRLAFGIDTVSERMADGTRKLRIGIENLELRDGDRSLFSLAAVRATGISFSGGLHVAALEIREPRLLIERLEDGTLLAMGLAIPPQPPAAADPHEETPSPPAAAPIRIDHVELAGLTVDYRQPGAKGPFDARVTVAATVDRISIGDAEPATFRVQARAAGMLEQLELTGNLRLGHGSVAADGRLQLTSIQPSGLGPFLPPGLEPITQHANLACAFRVATSDADDGGLRAEAGLSDLTLTGDDGPLLALDAARVRIDRFDPAHGVLHIAEVKVLGTKLDIARDATGATQLLGMRMVAGRSEVRVPEAVAVEASMRPATGAAMGGMEDVRIDDFEVELAELRVRDLAPGAPAPLRLQLRLRAMEPLLVLGPEIDNLPPLHLLLEGALDPLAGQLRLDLHALPFAPLPELRADFSAAALQVAAFERLLPQLQGRVQDDGIAGGRLTGQLLVQAQSRNPRSGPFDWSRDFRLEAELTDLHLRGAGSEAILAGIDAVRIDARRIAPATGDVEIRTIEVLTPRLHARQTAEGLHVLGLLLSPPASPAPQPPPPQPAEPASPTLSQTSTVSIASILLQGIDLVWRDETTTPPTELPFDMLDFEITGVSTRCLDCPEAIRFRGSLGTSAVDLPQRRHGSLFSGLLGAATSMVGAGSGHTATERRPLLDEISISGQLALVPSFHLDTKVNVNQFELTGLRGFAGPNSIEIQDGTFSAGIEANFDQSLGFSTDSKLVFRDLAIREPAGGPISSYLRLPMGLDAVLYALRDGNGEQHIPVNFRVGRQGISADRIAGMAVATLSELLTRAVARSPFRLLRGGLGSVGIGADAPVPGAERAQALAFSPGSISVAPEAAPGLESLAGEARADERLVLVLAHELGSADLKIATQLGNPPSAEVLSMIQGLRQRRDQLLARRAAEQQAVRVQAGVEGFDNPRLRDGLRAIDNELGTIERALDLGLDLLRPSAERRTDARSRRAALAVANQRLESVRQALIAHGVPAARIEVRRPQFSSGDNEGGGVTVTPRIREVR